MGAFTVKQEKFEGPLDLLLTLIEQRQFHVNDIALARITDDFLLYLKAFPHFPLAEGAQFAFIASALLLIKSKALLPGLSLSSEEEQSIEELEHRLKLLKRFRALSRQVRERAGKTPLFLPLLREVVPAFAPPKQLSTAILHTALQEILVSLPKAEALSKAVVQKIMTLEEMIENLATRIKQALKMEFGDFAQMHKGERVHVIVGFLALLELVKQGVVAVTQHSAFGKIMMEAEHVDIPRY